METLTYPRNINVFGLAFISTFCVIITLVNLNILNIFTFFSKFRPKLGPCRDRWVQDGIFQLTRRAFDADGQSTWVDVGKEVPSTEHKELLRPLLTTTKTPPAPPTGQTTATPKAPMEQQAITPGEGSDTVGVASTHSMDSEVISPIEFSPEAGVGAGTVDQSIELSEL